MTCFCLFPKLPKYLFFLFYGHIPVIAAVLFPGKSLKTILFILAYDLANPYAAQSQSLCSFCVAQPFITQDERTEFSGYLLILGSFLSCYDFFIFC